MIRFKNKLPPWVIWALLFPLIVLNSWTILVIYQYFRPLISIFVLAILLSFILNYPVKFLQRRGIKRTLAVFCVLLLSLGILVALGVTLVPLILGQLNDLGHYLPKWIASSSYQLQNARDWAANKNLPINLVGLATQLAERLSSQLQSVPAEIIRLAVDTVGSVLDVLLTIVLTFYFLLHGDRFWNGIFQWLPSSFNPQFRELLRHKFERYFIGQVTLAALLGLCMTVAFLILQVPFGLLFGIGIGMMALVPFGAALGLTLVSFLVAFKSFWLGVKVLVVAVLIEQIIENGIAPRILGGFIGLNPVWILITLLLAHKLGGLLGLLIAVPLAGFIKSAVHTWRSNQSIHQQNDAAPIDTSIH